MQMTTIRCYCRCSPKFKGSGGWENLNFYLKAKLYYPMICWDSFVVYSTIKTDRSDKTLVSVTILCHGHVALSFSKNSLTHYCYLFSSSIQLPT